MTCAFSYRHTTSPALGLGLASLLLLACTGDDTATSAGETDTESATASATATTTGATATGTTTGTSESETATTSGGASESATMGTTSGDNVCGDGILGGDEECDDGALNGTAESACNDDCTLSDPVCGNGILEVGEECDDGNTSDGDGCAADCTIEMADNVCGDGIVGDDEECDDGNDLPDDGCEPDCTISPPGECGNGILEWDELCDDGNLVSGDGCEDDCTPTPQPACQEPGDYISCDGALNKNDPLAPYQALGLACSDKINESILISNIQFMSPDGNAWQIAKGYGSYIDPNTNELLYSAREGEAFLIMSSGVVSAPNGQGIVTENPGQQSGNGSNNNPDDDAFLPGWEPSDDMSGVLLPQWQDGGGDPNDKIWFSFKTKTPGGTQGYAIDFAFFSSEWPTWVATTFNDLFVTWEVSENFVGNVSTIGNLPTTITALHPHWSSVPANQGGKTCNNFGTDGPGFSCGEPELGGTGFEGHAGTTWVRINQPIEENSDLEVFFFLADMGDTALASAVLLDRFRFNCDACIPADDPLCTSEIPDPNCCGVVLPM